MAVQKITKYAIRYARDNYPEPTCQPVYLARSGTKNDWTTDIFKASQFHSEPFHFSEIRKIIDSGEGEIVTVRITAEIS